MTTTFHPQVLRGAASNNATPSYQQQQHPSPSHSYARDHHNTLQPARGSSIYVNNDAPSSTSISTFPPSTGVTSSPPPYQSTTTAKSASSPPPTASSTPQQQRAYGLQHSSTSYALHPQSTPSLPIHLITASQYASLVYQHSNTRLNNGDEKILFPWLHGADVPNSLQAENFGFRNGEFAKVPRYRGLFTITAHGPRSDEREAEQEEGYDESFGSSSQESPLYASDESAHHHEGEADEEEMRKSSCESVFEDPSMRKEALVGEDSHTHSQNAIARVVQEEDESPHARQPTSASIATSYSSDSCYSTTSTNASSTITSTTLSSASTSSSSHSSGLSSSASSVYSYGPSSTVEEGEGEPGKSTACTSRHGSEVGHGHAHTLEEECASADSSRSSAPADKNRITKRPVEAVPYGPEDFTSVLVNSHLPSEILAYDESYSNPMILTEEEKLNGKDHQAVCLQSLQIPNNTISFRHFRLQRSKYASVSDVVIYHKKGAFGRGRGGGGAGHPSGSRNEEHEHEHEHEHEEEVLELARKVKVAQNKMRQFRISRGEDPLEYNVFIIIEPFHVIEEQFPHLVAVDSIAWRKEENTVNFVDKEHEEMRKLTKVSQIGENVFLGNTFDVPLPPPEQEEHIEDISAHSDVSSGFVSSCSASRRNSISSFSSYSDDHHHHHDHHHHNTAQAGRNTSASATIAQAQEQQGKHDTASNPHHFSICIEARDMAAMCTTRNLREREKYLDELQRRVVIQRDLAALRLKKVPHQSTSADSVLAKKNQKNMRQKQRKRSSASFWFSSSSSSSSEDDEVDQREHTSDYSECDDAHRMQQNGEEEEAEDSSDFGEFADEKELLFDIAIDDDAFVDATDGDMTLSPGRFPSTTNNTPPRAGKVSPPPPFSFQPATSSSTPIKLQYKKSKSLRIAREREEASKVGAAAAAAAAKAEAERRAKASLTQHEVLEISTDSIIHMECLATAQSFNQASVPVMVDAIVEYVVWLRTQARPHLRTSKDLQAACATYHSPSVGAAFDGTFSSNSNQNPGFTPAPVPFEPMARKVLIHCVDGYTDSSILALSYIMYDRAISLPEAYLYLQNECSRSFFVYNTDVAFLAEIEKRINLVVRSQGRDKFNDDVSDEEREAILEAQRIESLPTSPPPTLDRASSSSSAGVIGRGVGAATKEMAKNLIPRPTLFSRSSSKDSTASTSTMKADSSSSLPRGPGSASSRSSSSTSMNGTKEDSNAVSHAWFHSEHFDGHFPSRILDYLYLGNLSHASNALMLKELGITHVLSIGETALVPPSKQCAPSAPSSAARARTPTNSLWLEQSLGNITVMDIQDINDDGVDSILPHLVAGMDFIQSARAAGGKCLVHCRVGVSRSATVVIGQVMKDLDMSLADAYIMVRARRLNILIQPTVLFMHTLWQWEEQIRNSAIIDPKNGNSHPARSGRMCWPVLATEIANINAKYLNC